jgi:hypothetical protein
MAVAKNVLQLLFLYDLLPIQGSALPLRCGTTRQYNDSPLEKLLLSPRLGTTHFCKITGYIFVVRIVFSFMWRYIIPIRGFFMSGYLQKG